MSTDDFYDSIDPDSLVHANEIDRVFSLFNGSIDMDKIQHLQNALIKGDAGPEEIFSLMEDSSTNVINRIIGEGACPDCIQAVIVASIDSFNVDPHPLLVAMCVTWFTVGLHIGNNRD